MTIAIDFDNTITADPPLWVHFIHCAVRTRGHEVIICTLRHPRQGDAVERFCDDLGVKVPVVYTCNQTPKSNVCLLAGYSVDVWIDDSPQFCCPPPIVQGKDEDL